MHIDHDHVSGGHHHHHHHDHDHHHHDHDHCHSDCGSCQSKCEHTPMEELMALMQYMVGHNTAHANELAELAKQFQIAGNNAAYEQVMAAVSDFEKGNMRLILFIFIKSNGVKFCAVPLHKDKIRASVPEMSGFSARM